jgi:hypothetical protein
VVTTAHCVDVPWTDGPVVLIRDAATPVAEVHIHPNYDARTGKDDVAALLLAHPTTAAPMDAARWARLEGTAPGFVRWLADGKRAGLDLGAQCSTATDCGSDLCARASLTSAPICTNRCFPGNGSPCAPGLTCLPNEDVPGRYACFAPAPDPGATSSCHVEPRAPHAKASWPCAVALAIAALAIRLRRRARRTLIHMH